jgi:hypothetical protein
VKAAGVSIYYGAVMLPGLCQKAVAIHFRKSYADGQAAIKEVRILMRDRNPQKNGNSKICLLIKTAEDSFASVVL